MDAVSGPLAGPESPEGPEPRLTEGKRRVDPKTDGQTMRGKHPQHSQSDVGFGESSAFARKRDSRNILARSVRGPGRGRRCMQPKVWMAPIPSRPTFGLDHRLVRREAMGRD